MPTNTIVINKVRQPYGWLGNMSPFPITYQNQEWLTAEHLFQALRFTDPYIKQLIRSIPSPMTAKMISKKYKDDLTVKPLSDEDLDNMRLVLRLKLKQHPNLQQELAATGDADIIEDCTRRAHGSGLFWGAALQNGEWVGENWLGKLWMELRDTG